MTPDELRRLYAEAKHAFEDANNGDSGIAAGLRAVFEAGARVQWIPVEERLPEPDTKVQIWWRWSRNFRHGFGEFSSQGYWRPEGSNGNFNDSVTHWMPLPAAPLAKVEAGEEPGG